MKKIQFLFTRKEFFIYQEKKLSVAIASTLGNQELKFY